MPSDSTERYCLAAGNKTKETNKRDSGLQPFSAVQTTRTSKREKLSDLNPFSAALEP